MRVVDYFNKCCGQSCIAIITCISYNVRANTVDSELRKRNLSIEATNARLFFLPNRLKTS